MKKYVMTLVCLLLVSALIVASVGAVLKYEVLKPLGIERTESIIALPFVLMADQGLSYQINTTLDQMNNPTEPTEPPTEPEITEPPTTEPTEPTEPPTEPEPQYVPVDESWFDDALFIGDSRTVGLQQMARLGDADYFCAGSMSVFTVQKWNCSDQDFRDKQLHQVLSDKTYGKIYVHLGLNECGSDHDLVMEQYRDLVDLIQEKQPDAVVILQAILTVTERKAMDPNFSLERIHDLNSRIEALAEEKGFLYIDVNEWVADERGYMRSDVSYDGAHLLGTGYMGWSEWIHEQAGWFGIP